jgi:hypothetical protein
VILPGRLLNLQFPFSLMLVILAMSVSRSGLLCVKIIGSVGFHKWARLGIVVMGGMVERSLVGKLLLFICTCVSLVVTCVYGCR